MSARKATSVRYPDELLERVDTLVEYLRAHRPPGLPPSCRLTRSDVLLMAVDLGIRELDAKSKEGAT